VLTDRELEVIRLLAGGRINSEIATRMYLSLRTVESHRAQIRSKLGVESRAELGTWAREHGIVP
jgi:two-component system, NarL family, response regulator NreC